MAQILVIEDNPVNMRLVALLLQQGGHEVLQAATATQGIELAQQHLPPLVLMDMQLPGMDGMEATRVLKSGPTTQAIKIVALTAFAMKGDEEKMRAAGCDGYVTKPFRHAELLATVNALLPV
jgi:two-component system cell cycle response regulator DivK